MQECGLALNLVKCEFAQSSVSFLGHQVTASGIQPLAAKVAAITKLQPPTTVRDLQRYLGMLNYYRRFLPAAAHVLKPLSDVLRGNVARSKQLTWSLEMTVSFAASKRLLVDTVPLAHPDPTARIVVAADASDTHIGGVLQQVKNDAHRPLGFFSR